MNQTYQIKVMLFGNLLFLGTESGFSSEGNAVLMMRQRFSHCLPSAYARCWQMIDVSVSES